MDQTELLLKMLEQLKDDIARDQETARESRAKLHERVDDVLDRIAKIETTVAISGQIDAQVRSELDQLSTQVRQEREALKHRLDPDKGDIGVTVAAWGDLMKTGRRISWLLGIAGITSAGGALALLAGAWDYIRGLLRIS